MKAAPALYIWWSNPSIVDEIKSVLSFFSGCAGQLMCWNEASDEQGRWVIWSFNLSHPVCGCLLMFGWSWQDFCIHVFFFSSASRWTSENYLCSPRLRSEVRLTVWIFMWVHVHYTQTEKNPPHWAQKMFPVNEAGCSTKSTDDLPVVQLLQREANELCIISVLQRKESSGFESVIHCSLATFAAGFWNIKVRNSLLRLFHRSLLTTAKLFFFTVRAGVCSRDSVYCDGCKYKMSQSPDLHRFDIFNQNSSFSML